MDVLTTMSDASIPLTTGEWEEWGNPNEEEYFKCGPEGAPRAAACTLLAARLRWQRSAADAVYTITRA